MGMEITKTNVLIAFVVLEGVLVFVSIYCLSFVDNTNTTTLEREYMHVDICMDSEIDLPCSRFVPDPPLYKCDCKLPFQLQHDFKGTVTLYYELEFDQTVHAYASSKDDQQLLGEPGLVPAESCGNYSYDNNKKTIFPCGEIADSMFSDTFTLQRVNETSNEQETVPVEYTNLLTGNVLKFKNPPVEVLKNFSEPTNWIRDHTGQLPWEVQADLTGVENPAFRAWMDTGLRRKPVWRVQKTDYYLDGLTAGNYSFFIIMHYGVNQYNGTRTLILEAALTETERRSLGWGIALLSLAAVLLVAVLLRAAVAFCKRDPSDVATWRRDRLRNWNIRDAWRRARGARAVHSER